MSAGSNKVTHWSNACGYDGPYIVDGRPMSTVYTPDVTCPECKRLMAGRPQRDRVAMEVSEVFQEASLKELEVYVQLIRDDPENFREHLTKLRDRADFLLSKWQRPEA
jgi:hypothetical protein